MPQIFLEDGLEISYAPHGTLTDEDLVAKSLMRGTYKGVRAKRVERERYAPKPGKSRRTSQSNGYPVMATERTRCSNFRKAEVNQSR